MVCSFLFLFLFLGYLLKFSLTALLIFFFKVIIFKTLMSTFYFALCRVQLTKAITQGYDDNPWPLWTRSGK